MTTYSVAGRAKVNCQTFVIAPVSHRVEGNMKKLSWGILGVAKIATTKVIPAMQKSDQLTVTGIASRDKKKAEDAAAALGIPRAYGSYEEMLADPDIQCVYNPLPN